MSNTLGRWWWIVLVAAIVAGLGSFLIVSSQETVYESRVRLLIGDLSSDFDHIRAAEALTATYAEIATSDVLLESALTEAGSEADVRRLRGRVRAVPVGDSRVLLVTVTWDDREDSARLADAIAGALRTFPRGPSNLTVLDPATTDAVPRRVGFVTLIGTIAGAAVASSLLLWWGQPRTSMLSVGGRRAG